MYTRNIDSWADCVQSSKSNAMLWPCQECWMECVSSMQRREEQGNGQTERQRLRRNSGHNRHKSPEGSIFHSTDPSPYPLYKEPRCLVLPCLVQDLKRFFNHNYQKIFLFLCYILFQGGRNLVDDKNQFFNVLFMIGTRSQENIPSVWDIRRKNIPNQIDSADNKWSSRTPRPLYQSKLPMLSSQS